MYIRYRRTRRRSSIHIFRPNNENLKYQTITSNLSCINLTCYIFEVRITLPLQLYRHLDLISLLFNWISLLNARFRFRIYPFNSSECAVMAQVCDLLERTIYIIIFFLILITKLKD